MVPTYMNPVLWVLAILVGLLGLCFWRIRAHGISWATAKRWLLNVALALLVISVFMGLFFYANYKGAPEELFVKWMEIFLTAAIAFGTVIKAFWQCRQRPAFWAELCFFIAAHFLVLERLRWTTGGYFWLPIVIGLPEILVLFILLSLTLRVTPPPRK
jgi:cytochrome bd-type quinol oxidase subunit 2